MYHIGGRRKEGGGTDGQEESSGDTGGGGIKGEEGQQGGRGGSRSNDSSCPSVPPLLSSPPYVIHAGGRATVLDLPISWLFLPARSERELLVFGLYHFLPFWLSWGLPSPP